MIFPLNFFLLRSFFFSTVLFCCHTFLYWFICFSLRLLLLLLMLQLLQSKHRKRRTRSFQHIHICMNDMSVTFNIQINVDFSLTLIGSILYQQPFWFFGSFHRNGNNRTKKSSAPDIVTFVDVTTNQNIHTLTHTAQSSLQIVQQSWGCMSSLC